jgi:hypothetical protein
MLLLTKNAAAVAAAAIMAVAVAAVAAHGVLVVVVEVVILTRRLLALRILSQRQTIIQPQEQEKLAMYLPPLLGVLILPMLATD